MEFRKHTLANGLEIVAECNDDAYSTALGFFVKTGSRDETDEVAGVSHFLEHMTFKGTPSRTADDVNREFDDMGAYCNAFTNEENTVYYAAVLPEYQDQAVDLLGDIMRPSLREEDFDTEKQVIIEEIRMYDDQPPFGADEKCRAYHFGSHPLGRSVLGTVQSITDLSVDAMREYFDRRYSAGNIALVGAGKIDFDQLIKAAEKRCGAWLPFETDRDIAAPTGRNGFHVDQKEMATQEYVVQLAEGPTAEDPARYAAKILATILGDETGSRLYWELIDSGLADQASLGHYEYDGAGVFFSYMSCDPEQAADNLQRMLDIYRTAEADGITEKELLQARNKVSSRIVLSSERPRGRLFSVGGEWIQRRQYRSVRDDLDIVTAVTQDEVNAVLTKYRLSQGTTSIIGPLAEIARPK